MLGVGWDTLTRWAIDGRVPYVKVGPHGQRRYYLRDIQALLEPSKTV
jgi:predicted site-specific integrase-resolvase